MVCVGKRIWCYNYRIDAWYILDIPHTPTCFLAVDGKLCFGTTTGEIMQFDESLGTFDGQTIVAEWEMGYYNFGVDWLRKFIKKLFKSDRKYCIKYDGVEHQKLSFMQRMLSLTYYHEHYVLCLLGLKMKFKCHKKH